tara:strand:- start:42915 stop:43451 length:537 start_codon:yes stop_codon:yes gene_type:complete
MLWIAALVAAILLAIERVGYVLIWRNPAGFTRLCSRGWIFGKRDPVEALYRLFLVFKCIQVGVFVAWWSLFDGRFPPLPSAPMHLLVIGAGLFVIGQILNVGVFWRLGKTGVFYGNRLGHELPWVTGFPFSVVPHPQYVGTMISIWGIFLVMRYPHPDWIIVPLIQTLYLLLAMRLER